MQVIRGVWGFIPYANEFWSIYLQGIASVPIESWDVRCRCIVEELSARLSALRLGPERNPAGALVDELASLRQFPCLYYEAILSLQYRSSGEHRFLGASSGKSCTASSHLTVELTFLLQVGLLCPEGIQDILWNYQTTIRQILTNNERWDSTSSEFELFRQNFSGHAYLCRFVCCQFSACGFDNMEDLVAHEVGHTPSFPCTEPGCQYPPFGSTKALRRHATEAHSRCGVRRVVRKAAIATAGIAQSLRHQTGGIPVPGNDDDLKKAGETSRNHGNDAGDVTDVLYCFCNQVSYGEMVACDAEDCTREWFHLECVGLEVAPEYNGRFLLPHAGTVTLTSLSAEWYCEDCKKRLRIGESVGGSALVELTAADFRLDDLTEVVSWVRWESN